MPQSLDGEGNNKLKIKRLPDEPSSLNGLEPLQVELGHLELRGFLGLGVQHVHGTAQSGIKGTDDPHDIKWVFDVLHRCPNEGLFDRSQIPLIIPG